MSYRTARTLRGGRRRGIGRNTQARYSFRRRRRLRARPDGDLAAVGEAELGQDVLDVVLRGAFGDVQGRGDLPVGQSLPDQPGDFPLARAERRQTGRQAGPASARTVAVCGCARLGAAMCGGRRKCWDEITGASVGL